MQLFLLLCLAFRAPFPRRTANTITPMTQDTKFICPGINEAKSLPELYKLGWRLIQLGGNNRFAAGVSKMSLLAILEKD